MAKKYQKEPENPNKTCKARGNDIRVHFKNTYECARAIKKMNLRKAQKYLEQVISHQRCIPYRKFTSSIGHTAQAKEFGKVAGRWPKKSCRVLLDLLKNAQSNAEFKSLDVDNVIIDHIHVNRAQKGRRRTYRAHGRINPYMSHPCHVQIILKEVDESVERPEKDATKKIIRLTKSQLLNQRIRLGGGVTFPLSKARQQAKKADATN